MVTGDSTQRFFYYDLNTSILTQSTSPTYNRVGQNCIGNDYSGDGETYLYLIGGDTIYIERINMYDIGSGWETLGVTLNDVMNSTASYSSGVRHLGIVGYYNYIYFIAGRVAAVENPDVVVFNVETMKLFKIGEYPYLYSHVTSM